MSAEMAEPLVHEVRLNCSVDHAFEVFTRLVDIWWPIGHRRFPASKLHYDVREGGQLVERGARGEQFVLADVVTCTPPHLIEMLWHPGKISQPTTTVIRFTSHGAHEAQVTVTHTEGAAELGETWATRAVLFNKGWAAVLSALSDFIGKEGRAR